MNARAKKWILTVLRWTVAAIGIWWVLSNMSLRNSVLVVNPSTNLPARASLAGAQPDDAATFDLYDPATGQRETVPANRVVNPAVKKHLQIVTPDGGEAFADLLGMRLAGDINRNPSVQALLVQPAGSKNGLWISPGAVVGGYRLDVPRPRVEVGIISMVQHARPGLLVLAIVIFPITFLITSYRWEKLLSIVGAAIPFWRVFRINMVGAFYNTFMPGSTGGDVFKAYYATRQTPNRMAAVMSVVIDRILGLLALVMVGGVMAALQFAKNPRTADATSRACLQVAIGSIVIIAAVGIGLAILFQQNVRRMLGLEFLLGKLPMQRQIESARAVLRVYRDQPVLVLWALLVTIPVHLTVIVSALLAGQAFNLPIRPLFYFTAVPVIVLVGSIPISPQGAGVMEFFAVQLTQRQGTTISQAFALTMSIRLVQILWNLVGGIFVLRGGFHAPTEAEERELEADADGTFPPSLNTPPATP